MIRLQIGHEPASLPNVNGFRFRGVLGNGDLIPCVVLRDREGLHHAFSEPDHIPVYHKLRGWMQYLPPQKEAQA